VTISRRPGVISERDYITKIALLGRTSKETKVKEISTAGSKLITAKPDEPVQKCMEKMLASDIRHLPLVKEDGTLMGMISIKDLVKATLKESEQTIKVCTVLTVCFGCMHLKCKKKTRIDSTSPKIVLFSSIEPFEPIATASTRFCPTLHLEKEVISDQIRLVVSLEFMMTCTLKAQQHYKFKIRNYSRFVVYLDTSMCLIRSKTRLEYPASLSYQETSLTKSSVKAIPAFWSKIEE
jgi:predicted transcriptional regulator